MKKLFFSTLLMLPFLLMGQDPPAYSMYETLYMVPKMGSNTVLKTNMGNHNKKFHAEDPFQASIWSVLNGSRTGSLVWIMGPATWSQHDGRPASKAHDEDWDKNVIPHLSEITQAEYWKMAPEVSYFPANFTLAKQQVWIVDVKDFESHRFDELLKKVVAVYKAKDIDTPFGVYKNQLSGGDGRDVAVVWFFDKWAWKDEETQFAAKFDEVHGPQSWRFFMREWEAVTDGLQVELRTYEPDMSGGNPLVEVPAQ